MSARMDRLELRHASEWLCACIAMPEWGKLHRADDGIHDAVFMSMWVGADGAAL
jgi:hypothetical protein